MTIGVDRCRAVPRLRSLEILANLPLGVDGGATPLPAPRAGGLRAGFDEVLIEALGRPPCLVSFSGGRDSSAVLALALDAARRHGMAPPVPVTMRFPGADSSDETHWQELVLDHLGVSAEVVTVGDELDAIGEHAREFLRRHGLRWPGNAHMHAPVLALARGGTLLTGIGGDELLGTSSPPRSRRARLLASLPGSLRAEVIRMRRPSSVGDWLTPRGRVRVQRALAREEARWPYPWDEALDYWYSSRAYAALAGTLGLLGADLEVKVVNPLLDPRVLAELRVVGTPTGFPSRTEAMRLLCGELLPQASLSRPTKASFGDALWGAEARAFVARWDGRGVDRRYVDPERLRSQLGEPEPDFRMILLIQQAWLASEAGPAEARSGGGQILEQSHHRIAGASEPPRTDEPQPR
jgi:hypothetical protein